MTRLLNPEKLRNGAANLLILAFFILLWLPILDSFLNLDKAPHPNEKRAPAKFPAFTPGLVGLRDFLAGLEAYYNDHFGFRKRLIRWHNRWKGRLFKESSVPNVMIGQDGWLFFSGEYMIEYHRGTKPFEPERLVQWQKLLESRRDWLAKRGIAYVFAIPPDKHSVYPEYLPEWMTRIGPTTRLDQFAEHMRNHSTVEVLDLRKPLIDAKKTARTYLYTDTHWDWFGSFIAYQALMQTLSKQLPGVEPLSIEAFEQKTQNEPGGDLARLLGQENSMPEKDRVSFQPRPPLEGLKMIVQTNLLNKKWLKDTEPLITENPKQKGTAIVFRDSFSGGWIPFLGHHFNRVVYLWQYHWDPAFIEREKPDVVIDEVLERFLNRESPVELMKKEALPK